MGAALGADPLQFVLAGGDDHALVATFPRRRVTARGVDRASASVSEGEGVTVDGEEYDGPTGHRHF